MSGGPGLNFNTESDLVANNTADIANQVGCVKDGDSQSAETVECLRKADANTLANLSVSASRAARPPFGEAYFFPTLDHDFIQDRPSQLMREGKFAKGVPIIASWVTNDGAWYAPPSTSTDEDVLGTFGLWLSNLSSSTKNKLLELYPVEDFEHMVRREYDGDISAQYYRAAQMNRDIWFTCPVLDFAWQYVRHGGSDLSQVRLFEHNATRFSPSYEKMGVPMWRVAHLSDIPYVLNSQRLEGGADNSPEHLDLAKNLSRAITHFVDSGSPEGGSSDGKSWPAAFADVTQKELSEDFPSKLTLLVSGGPHGTEAVTVAPGGTPSTDAEHAVYWEKLFSRCEVINSHQMRDEAGV